MSELLSVDLEFKSSIPGVFNVFNDVWLVNISLGKTNCNMGKKPSGIPIIGVSTILNIGKPNRVANHP